MSNRNLWTLVRTVWFLVHVFTLYFLLILVQASGQVPPPCGFFLAFMSPYLSPKLCLECFLCYCCYRSVDPSELQLRFLKQYKNVRLYWFKIQSELNLLLIRFELECLPWSLSTWLRLQFCQDVCLSKWDLCLLFLHILPSALKVRWFSRHLKELSSAW